jgi:hypothetical protein
VEPVEQVVVALPETLTLACVKGSNRDVHFVDQVRLEKRTNRRDASTDADIFSAGCLFCHLQCLSRIGVDKVKRRITEAERWPRIVRENEHWRMKRRIVSPPSLPLFVFPRSPLRPELVSAHDFGADVVIEIADEVIVETSASGRIRM